MSNSILNEQFEVSVADGFATYEIARDYGDGTVEVELVADFGVNPDGYSDAILGDSCRVSRENVEAFIARKRRYSSF